MEKLLTWIEQNPHLSKREGRGAAAGGRKAADNQSRSDGTTIAVGFSPRKCAAKMEASRSDA
ncbi:MAG: hypothetical protein ABIQ12_00130 [Opitutaceae bacterium]